MRPWLAYTLLRIGLFVGVLAILLLLGIDWWLAALFAAVIGLCVSIIFFGGMRQRITADVERRRRRAPVDVDALAEDDDSVETDRP